MKNELEIRRVLIVDDEETIRDVLVDMLNDLNLPCDVACDGAQALEMLRTNAYHAVLCDIMMPEMNGLECLAKAQAENVVTPFIFVTGFEDSMRMLQAIRLGAVDFIGKPFNNKEIADVLFRVLDIGMRRKRIYQAIENSDPEVLEKVKKDERMISIMRNINNNKRVS